MIRNLVIGGATLLILIVLFLGYTLLVGGWDTATRDGASSSESLPQAAQFEKTDALRPVANVPLTLAPGQGGGITIYDPRSGRPVRRFEYASWRPVPESKNEIWISKPRLVMLSGARVASITADEGQVAVERVDRSEAGWKSGHLTGHVTIHVDPRMAEDEAALTRVAGPSPERITITMADMRFDLELGKIRTDGPITAGSADFDLVGVGLNLTWNQASNRVEELTIARGQRLFLRGLADLASLAGGGTRAAGTADGEARRAAAGADPDRPAPELAADAPAPAEPAESPTSQPRSLRRASAQREKKQTAYVCSLDGVVKGERRVAGAVASSLLAEGGIRLLFDVGGADAFELGRATSRPASMPDDGGLTVTWDGPLNLSPAPAPDRESPRPGRLGHDTHGRRRHFEALGPVTLTHSGGGLRCGRLEYHDETGRVWLTPIADSPIRLSMGAERSATARSIYIDRKANVVKLVGDVELEMRSTPDRAQSLRPAPPNSTENDPPTGPPPPRQPPASQPDGHIAATQPAQPLAAARSFVRCSQIAELTLWEADPAASQSVGRDELGALNGAVRSATFMGDVEVKLGHDRVRSQSLELGFRRAAGNESFENLLTSVVATGEARLSRKDDSIVCGRMVLGLSSGAGGAAYPSSLDAFGAVTIQRGSSRLSGDHITAVMRSPLGPVEQPVNSRESIILDTLEVEGRAELVDPQRQIAARGHRLTAVTGADGKLDRAQVTGTSDRFALAYHKPYTLRGLKIDLISDGRSVHIDGPSLLRFESNRSLQGEKRGRAVPVTVRGEKLLHIDGDANRVRVEGNVTAASGDERLRGSTLTLTLEDRPRTDSAANDDAGIAASIARIRRIVIPANDPEREPEFVVESRDERFDKEPLRLTVEDAVLASETFEAGQRAAVTHSSLEASRLDVDIANRQMQTTGQTTLLMTDYRPERSASDGVSRSPGLAPSNLMSGGPSQTLIVSDQGMTYAMGEAGPERRDSVIMEGGVFLVHRVGKDMVNVEQTPLAAKLTKEEFEKLRDRHTTMRCRRLEAQFGAAGGKAAAAAAASGAETPLARLPGAQLLWMVGTGDVELTDRQGTTNSEIHADRVNFDRKAGAVGIFGTPAADARVFRWDTSTSKFSTPATGREFELDLINNTLRTGRTVGEIRP